MDRIFTLKEAQAIKCIPLSRAVKEDVLVRRGDDSGEYSVRNGYKTLFNQKITEEIHQNYSLVYRKLWLLNIPSKIKITI